MLKIKDYRNYWNKFKNSVPELEHILLVSSESEMSKRISSLRDKRYILSVVLPSADINASGADDMAYNYDAAFFVLSPAVNSLNNENSFIDNFDKSGEITQLIIETMANDAHSGSCHLFHDLDFGSFKIDPEVNFLSCNGYSVTFKFKYPL